MPLDPDTPSHDFVAAVMRACREQKISQRALAAMIGAHESSISHIKHGKTILTYDRAVQIARILHINLGDVDNAWRR